MKRTKLIGLIAAIALLFAACGSSDTDTGSGSSYGDNAELDSLVDACRDGNADACDDLFWDAPSDTEYEEIALNCGGAGAGNAPGRCAAAASGSTTVESDLDAAGEIDAAAADDQVDAADEMSDSSDEAGEEAVAQDVEGGNYGDDPELDALWDACDEGDGEACDDLFWASPSDSTYETFGATCGGLYDLDTDNPSTCDDDDDSDGSGVVAGAYGDDPRLDLLWDTCESGDMASCDALFWESPTDSEYELFGGTCGGEFEMADSPYSCENPDQPAPGALGDGNTYGDNPELDDLWDACETGDGQACDDLFWGSAGDSDYENFGNTCGLRFDVDDVPLSCADTI